jgi:hypothetical protein
MKRSLYNTYGNKSRWFSKKNWGCLKIGSLYTPFHSLIHHFPNEIDILRGSLIFRRTQRWFNNQQISYQVDSSLLKSL